MQLEGPINNSNPATFITTHWTRVLEARGNSTEARAALSDLCAAYYPPVFAFIRCRSKDQDSARELTQEFFARLLSDQGIASVDPQFGRFRSFLLGAVKHFLADMRDRSQRLKRGGGVTLVSLESLSQADDSTAEIQVADAHSPSPDLEFDRKWALTMLERALNTLARENKEGGHSDQFEALKPWLTGDAEEFSQVEVARRLAMSEGAARVAIHRLRRRFRDLIKAEIAQTLNDPGQVGEELGYLLAALG
jgi:RNA polymerase sigma-70 factor (ECF subfamily)